MYCILAKSPKASSCKIRRLNKSKPKTLAPKINKTLRLLISDSFKRVTLLLMLIPFDGLYNCRQNYISDIGLYVFNMPQVNCVIIWERKAIEFTRCKTLSDTVLVSKSWQPQFTLNDFIPEIIKKRFWQFWKRGSHRNFLILREGVPKAILPPDDVFNKYWTKDEVRKFTEKLVAKSAVEQKPFTNWQVLALVGAILAGSIISALLTRYLLTMV